MLGKELGKDRKSEMPSTSGRNVFLRKVKGLSLLDKAKSIDICQSLNIEPLLLRHRTIAAALVWPCDTNVPRANSKVINGCSSEWQKA